MFGFAVRYFQRRIIDALPFCALLKNISQRNWFLRFIVEPIGWWRFLFSPESEFYGSVFLKVKKPAAGICIVTTGIAVFERKISESFRVGSAIRFLSQSDATRED